MFRIPSAASEENLYKLNLHLLYCFLSQHIIRKKSFGLNEKIKNYLTSKFHLFNEI